MKIAVLGSGIVGSSVALAAVNAGHDVLLYGEYRMSDADANKHPTFASAYPAASIIPHSIASDSIDDLLKNSDNFFNVFSQSLDTGVRIQQHYELFERKQSIPLHATVLANFAEIDNADRLVLPRRDDVAKIFGYKFKCFFCDMPVYGAWLDKKVNESRIKFERQSLTSETVIDVKADILVNCLGVGSNAVFPSTDKGFLSRGILLSYDYRPNGCEPLSYNYTPAKSYFSTSSGRELDVYFYPRSSTCILGGTRQLGQLDSHGNFAPDEEIVGGVVEMDGVEVPRPIVDLNKILIKKLTGHSLGEPTSVLVGYRHMVGSPEAPALVLKRAELEAGRLPRIDCLGFGGSGVTLSWGSAMRVLDLISEIESSGSDQSTSQSHKIAKAIINQ